MKLTVQIFFITFLLMGCTNKQQVRPLKPIHVATGNWEPFIGEDLPQDGPVAQMITSILVEVDYLPIFKYYDWGFVHTHLEAGYPSFAFPYIKGDDTARFKYSAPIVQLEYVLYYYNNSGNVVYHFNSLQDIVSSGKRIGQIRGYTKFPGIDADSVYIEVPGTIDGFKMLVDGDIDFLIEAKQVGQLMTMSNEIPVDATNFYYLGQADLSTSADNPVFVKDLPFRIKFSPKVSDEFINNINRAISTCSETEYYKSLVKKLKGTQQEFLKAYLTRSGKEQILGYPNPGSKQPVYVFPLSTEVAVIQWDKTFLDPINPKEQATTTPRSQVKIMNGPLKGRVVWVENDQIELSKK